MKKTLLKKLKIKLKNKNTKKFNYDKNDFVRVRGINRYVFLIFIIS